MNRILCLAATTTLMLTAAAQAQSVPETVAEALQQQGVTDIVVYAGRGGIRATGLENGAAFEAFYSRDGEQVDAPADRASRAEVRDFIEGLRASYNAETDGSFRDYVTAGAAAIGLDLPEPGGRGGPEGRAGGDRPERGGAAEADGNGRPDRGDRGDRPGGPDAGGPGAGGPGAGAAAEAES